MDEIKVRNTTQKPQIQNMVQNTPQKTNKPIGLYVIICILLALLSGLGYWSFKQYQISQKATQELQKLKGGKVLSGDEETKLILDKVSELIILPDKEQPTIATVTDLEKLKGQAFFINAKVGDKVLIYTNAKKAILYRPSENKIIELAPLNLGVNATTTP